MSIFSRIKNFFGISAVQILDDDLSDIAPYKVEPPASDHGQTSTAYWPFPTQQPTETIGMSKPKAKSKPAKARPAKPKAAPPAPPAKQKKPKAAAITASPKSKQKAKLFVDGHGDVQEAAAKKQPVKKKRQFDKKPKAPKTN